MNHAIKQHCLQIVLEGKWNAFSWKCGKCKIFCLPHWWEHWQLSNGARGRLFCFFDSGVPVFKYVTKESVENADAEGMQKSIENVIGGFAKKWKHASVPIHIAIFVDVLSPIRRVSIAFQQNKHDPMKAVWRIQEFNWTMTKLKILMNHH